MTVQLSVALRNARVGTIETTIGVSPRLRLYSGAQPADCASAPTGTLLVDMVLPSDWMNAPASGAVTKNGTWSGTGTAGAGAGTNAGYWRITDNAGTNCHMQGSVTATGGGGDMTLDNISISNGQAVAVNTFTATDGNP